MPFGVVAGGDEQDRGGVDPDAVDARAGSVRSAATSSVELRRRDGRCRSSRARTRRPRVRDGELGRVAARCHRSGRGRSAAAAAASWSRDTPRSRSRSSSGAVKPRWRIWFEVRDAGSRRRALRDQQRPDRFDVAVAGLRDPATPDRDSAARAASTASSWSDLPSRRRSWRFGRSTSITSTPAAAEVAGQPGAVGAGALDPDPFDRAERRQPAVQLADTRPASSGTTRRRARRRCASTTAATCTSRWVSTPPVTGRVASTMVIAIPSLSTWSRGGTHVPGRRPCRASCSQQPARSPSGTGRALFADTRCCEAGGTYPAAPSNGRPRLGTPPSSLAPMGRGVQVAGPSVT